MARTLLFHGGEAVHAYEEGGSPALADWLARIESAYGFHGELADPEGRALSGAPDNLATLVERAGHRRVFTDFSRRALVLAAPLRGRHGQYWFFLLLPTERFGFWPRVRQALALPHLWALGCIILLSFALARRLTKPVLQLHATAERLGHGDFSARVRSQRQDELGQLARTFDSMAERIERAVTAQRQLLQDVSHELRSPLSRLAVAVELARSSPDPSQALDRVGREADRLNALVGELLATSRDRLQLSSVDLSALLAEVVQEAQIEAQARQCRLTIEAPPQLELAADAELVRRAVENVTRNGVQYTAPGTEVRVTAGRAGELHGGTISASNTHPGLRVVLALPATAIMKES